MNTYLLVIFTVTKRLFHASLMVKPYPLLRKDWKSFHLTKGGSSGNAYKDTYYQIIKLQEK